MIKLTDIILENKILVPRRSKEERAKNQIILTNQKIQQYIKKGSKGDLDLHDSQITSLPNDLKIVRGTLDLTDSKIESLPDGFMVDGHLNLAQSQIKSLPNDLSVDGTLNLWDTKITQFPINLNIGGTLSIADTPLRYKYPTGWMDHTTKYKVEKLILKDIEDRGGSVLGRLNF